MTTKDWLEDFESRVQSVRLDVLSTCYNMETQEAVSKLVRAVDLLHRAQTYIGKAKGLIGEE